MIFVRRLKSLGGKVVYWALGPGVMVQGYKTDTRVAVVQEEGYVLVFDYRSGTTNSKQLEPRSLFEIFREVTS